jgi:hypothetical protein
MRYMVEGPFTIIADESRDVSNCEQLCIAVRFLNRSKIAAEERFVSLSGISSIKGMYMCDCFTKFNGNNIMIYLKVLPFPCQA